MEDDTTWTNFLTNDYRPLVIWQRSKNLDGRKPWEFVPAATTRLQIARRSKRWYHGFLFDKAAVGTFIGKMRDVHVADTPQVSMVTITHSGARQVLSLSTRKV